MQPLVVWRISGYRLSLLSSFGYSGSLLLMKLRKCSLIGMHIWQTKTAHFQPKNNLKQLLLVHCASRIKSRKQQKKKLNVVYEDKYCYLLGMTYEYEGGPNSMATISSSTKAIFISFFVCLKEQATFDISNFLLILSSVFTPRSLINGQIIFPKFIEFSHHCHIIS